MLPRSIQGRLTGLFVLIFVAASDQWSKTAILHAADAATIPREILPMLNLVLVHNRGISFGFFAQMQPWMPLLLTVATSVITLLLFVWLTRAHDAVTPAALGSIIGGAAGNITDRVRLGAVTDFLDFHVGVYHWPAFNLADSAIFMGVVILVLIGIVGPSGKKEKPCDPHTADF